MIRKIVMILMVAVLIAGVSKLSFAMNCSRNSRGMQLARAEVGNKEVNAESSEIEPTKKAEDAGNKICPVSGEKIEEKTKATYEYQGKIYNFCCPMCIEEFKKDPEKYIKKIEEETRNEAVISAEETEETGMMEMEHHRHSR